jgi:hypothetical protein
MPQDQKTEDEIEVLPIDTPGGAEVSIGSTSKDFDLIFSLGI